VEGTEEKKQGTEEDEEGTEEEEEGTEEDGDDDESAVVSTDTDEDDEHGMSQLSKGSNMLSQAETRTLPAMHLIEPNFTQHTTEKKKSAMYIVVCNVQYEGCLLLKIGVTQESVGYLKNRYRTSMKYFVVYWHAMDREVDRAGLSYYDKAMKDELTHLTYLRKLVINPDALAALEAKFSALDFAVVKAEYLNTGEVYQFVNSDSDNMEDLQRLVDYFRSFQTRFSYTDNGKIFMMNKVVKGLKDELFNSTPTRVSLAEVVYKLGHFDSDYITSDRADFPLSGISVRNLCDALYKLLKNKSVACQDKDEMWTLVIMWVGIGECCVNKSVYTIT
jgi:hypothetical protein